MERRTFTKEFNQEAVQISYDSNNSVAEVAKNLGIRPELLYLWRSEQRQEGEDAFPGKGKTRNPALKEIDEVSPSFMVPAMT